MQLRIFTEPQQGATYDDLLAVARRAEDSGFDAFFRSDHYLTMGGDGLPGPTDAWITLAGLARETTRIRLGTLMTAATFRLPGPLAIQVAQVDQMSGGRVELGLGAGWFEEEHAAYGIPFPELGERFDRLEEQLAIITGLWDTPPGETFAFDGEHYRLAGSPALPKPVQDGGPADRRRQGEAAHPAAGRPVRRRVQRPVRLARGQRPAVRRVREACAEAGRDPATWCTPRRWCSAWARTTPRWPAARPPSAGRSTSCARRPGRHARRGGRRPRPLRGGGRARVYLQILDLADLDHLELVAAEVAPQLG